MANPRWSDITLTVSEVTRRLQDLIEPSFRGLEVRGEIVSARPTGAGHVYFTLKDAGAQLPCVFWRTALLRHPGRIEDGMQVVARGDLQLYAPHGRYQLIVQRLADIGFGELLARLEELKRKLQAEGLFEVARKRLLPFLPRRIGLITAATGAALHDFVVTAWRRYPVPIVLGACRVQGDLAAVSIVGAIRALSKQSEIDVIVLARGGGSTLDLLAFSDERVVRAIAACAVPVVSAVGHEIDTTLADLVADRRVATPTAAAELVVPRRDELARDVERGAAMLAANAERLIAERRQHLDELKSRVERALARRLEQASRRLSTLRERLQTHHPRARLMGLKVRQLTAAAGLREAARGFVTRRRETGRVQAERLRLLSPLASLDRGWALVRRQSGSVVRQVADVALGEEVSILMRDGSLAARIVRIAPQGED